MRHFSILLAAVALVACGKPKAPHELKIALPHPPSVMQKAPEAMTDQEKLAVLKYMAEHYFDNMPFADTTYIEKEVTIQTYSDWAYMLNNLPLSDAKTYASKVMDKAKVDSVMYFYFAKLAHDHFYDPNSPYRNDDIYASVLENIIAWDGAGELRKIAPRAQLAVIPRNRLGEQATDFAITLEDGVTVDLYAIHAPYTLLYFNMPDCPICGILTEDLTASSLVGRLLASGKMKIVTVYPESNLDLWREHLVDTPASWMRGYALGMRNGGLYDLRPLPSMYLLDDKKKVLLKDASTATQIEHYFDNL